MSEIGKFENIWRRIEFDDVTSDSNFKFLNDDAVKSLIAGFALYQSPGTVILSIITVVNNYPRWIALG